MKDKTFGYAGKIFRVDLTKRECSKEEFRHEDRVKWIGGTGLGAKILILVFLNLLLVSAF